MNFLKLFLLFGAIFASCEAFCCRSKLSWKRWNKNDLTYRILNYPSQYRKEYTDFIFQRAFELYNQNAGITFKAKKIGHVDITIRFDRNSEHAIFRMKDAISFSFPPGPHEYSGDIIFNDDVVWTTDGGRYDLFKRMIYEIGIAVGLTKNNRETSVMNPMKEGYALQLDFEDREVREILKKNLTVFWYLNDKFKNIWF